MKDIIINTHLKKGSDIEFIRKNNIFVNLDRDWGLGIYNINKK